MAEALKDKYNEAFVRGLYQAMQAFVIVPEFKDFKKKIFVPEWASFELKQRMRHITEIMTEFFPDPFPDALEVLVKMSIKLEEKGIKSQGLEYLILPDYLELNGQAYPRKSLEAMEKLTQFVSCEFAIRPFIRDHTDLAFKYLYKWSVHEDYRVRRLSSEGCRPRLPWGIALKKLQTQPEPILPILNNLKNDPSEYVRKSVANNLNDISKDHVDLVLDWATQHYGQHSKTDWIIKHGLRTLLKKGNHKALDIIGFGKNPDLVIDKFQLMTKELMIGEALSFKVRIDNKAKEDLQVRAEYAIYYLLANGQHAKKVFKLSEFDLSGEHHALKQKQHSFRPITTRRFYPGPHFVSVIVNGSESEKLSFELLPEKAKV